MADDQIPKYEDMVPLDQHTPKYEDMVPLDHGTTPEQESVSGLKALVVKLGHGISGGLNPRINGILSAAGRAVGVNGVGGEPQDFTLNPDGPTLDKEELLKAYEQGKNKLNDLQDQAQIQHPLISTVGDVVGMAASPINKLLPNISVAKTAPLFAKAAAGAVNLGTAGGALGLANTKDYTNVPQALQDAKHGVETGMAIGGLLPIGGALASGAVNQVAETPMIQKILDMYKAGRAGTDLSNPTTFRDALKEKAGAADDAIRAKLKDIFGQKDAALDAAEAAGKTVDVQAPLQGLGESANGGIVHPDDQALLNDFTGKVMQQGQGYTKSPKELENLIRQVKSLKGQSRAGSDTQKAADQALQQLQALQNSLDPAIQGANNQAFQVADAGEALTGKNPLDYLNSKQDLTMRNNLANKLEKSGQTNTDSDINEILNGGLSTSKNRAVGGLKQTVPVAADAIESAAQDAKNLNLSKMYNGNTDATGLGKVADVVTGGAGKVAYKAGAGVTNTQEFVQAGVRRLSDATPDNLKTLANVLSTKGGEIGAGYAQALSNAAQRNTYGKNAIIFGLMQQPTFRALLHTHSNESIEADPTQTDDNQ